MKFTKKNGKNAKVPRSVARLFPKVTEVVDANEPVEVNVTEEDCGPKAKSKEPNECAMARALRRQFKAEGAIIGLTKSYIVMGKRALRYTTPATVAREVTSFDRHHDFAPGDYKLAAVSESQRMGAHRDKPSGKGGGDGRLRRVVHRETVRVRVLGK